MIYSDRIKHLRKYYHLTQDDLSKKLDIKRHTICDWESERTEPNITALKKISEVFNITVDYLLGYDNTEEPTNYKVVKKFRTKDEFEHNLITEVLQMPEDKQRKLLDLIYQLKNFNSEDAN